MASLFVMKRFSVSNLLTRSISMFPRTLATTSRSFNTDRRLAGYVHLSYYGCIEKSNDKEGLKLCLNMGMKGEVKRIEDNEVKSTLYYNFLDMIKKKEFSHRDEEFIATLKDGVCKLSFPDLTEKGEINEVEIKLI